MKKSIGSITLLSLIVVVFIFYSSLGTRPSSISRAKFESSKQYNKIKGMFENRVKGIVIEMKKTKFELETLKDWFYGWKGRVPDKKIVFQKPALELHELPNIDYILISHDHYDHLDSSTIKYFINKDVKFVTPLGVGSHLIGWGVDKDKIVEKDWWETANFDNISFTATPAQHFSGRDGIHDNETLWASWVLKSENHNLYFSGDSGYDTHFKEIGEKLGPFDIAFLESGQYNKRWPNVHMFPNEAVQAFKDLKAKNFFPVHWGMFQLALHDWKDPIEKIFKLTNEKNISLIAPKLGEIVILGKYSKVEKWW